MFKLNRQNTPSLPSTKAYRAASIIAVINIMLFVSLLVYLGTFFGGGLLCLPMAMVIVILCVIVGTIWNRVKKTEIGMFTASIGISLLLVVGVALIGFYGKNTEVVSFDSGGTWVSDKGLGTALLGTIFYPSIFTAAALGYDCNNAYGPNCSDTFWLFGYSIDGAIVAGGVITGNILARRRLRLICKESI